MELRAISCQDAWRRMTDLAAQGQQRNYVQNLDMSDFTVETALFPVEALEAYSAYNMERSLGETQRAWLSENRGGAQGDYRAGMGRKIDNVVDCLNRFPKSKRAVIATSNDAMASHESDADAKCLRELHLYLDEDGKLSGSVYFRAQAASLFPKNLHMIGSIMTRVASQLPKRPALGTLFYVTTILVSDRR
jgi:thymidylate synthase